MKRIFALITACAFIFMSCGPSAPKNDVKPAGKTTASPIVYKNGIYKVTYDAYDSHGWKPNIEIQVREGKVVSATYDYTNKDGKRKSEDKAYAEAMKGKSGLDQNEAATKLIQKLVDKNAADIDNVAGATSSSTFFKEAAAAGLEKALTGDSKELILPMNDTYKAEDKDYDERGWKGVVSITFKGGKIEKVLYEELNKEGKQKKDDNAYNTAMKDKTKVSWAEAAEKLAAELTASQDLKKVDTVAGATGTTTRFKTLAEKALSVR